jgi:hypothetical protein
VRVLLQKFVASSACLSAFSCIAGAPGSPVGAPDPAALALPFGIETSLSGLHASTVRFEPLNRDVSAEALQPQVLRDALNLAFSRWVTPWLSLHADTIFMRTRSTLGGDAASTRRLIEQAGATLYPTPGWNASLFVNYLSTSPAAPIDGLRGPSASFVNARVNHDLSTGTRVSLDVMNIFDKRVDSRDAFGPAADLWADPQASESMLVSPGASRGFRLRLRTTF